MAGVGRAAGALLLLAFAALVAPREAAARTIVTISLDDAVASQADVPAILEEFGVRASFFVPSGRVGRRGNLTWAQVHAIAAAGHEIGGHTLDHQDLTTLSLAEARRVVCEDRANLVAQGFDPVSFAYPFGHADDQVAAIVGECGYQLARKHGGIRSPTGCGSCPTAESIPPPDPLQLRTSQSVRNTYGLADLQGYVLQAEQGGGGWINVNLHEVLDDCSGETYRIEVDLLRAFLAWLEPRAAVGTVVLPMGEALGAIPPPTDTTPPTVALLAPAAGATVVGTVLLRAAASDDVGVARVDFLVDGVLVGSDGSPPFEIGWNTTGVPDGAVVLTAVAWDAAGNAATSAPVGVTVANAPGRSVVLPFGSSWRYWGSWRDPGASWMTLPLDARWLEGRGELGFGDGDERSRLDRAVWKSPTVYFRRTIELDGAVREARLQVRYDDGMAVFVNGVRVASDKVASLDHLAWATGASENAHASFLVPPSVFRTGINEIAVLVKQESPDSDDLSFDLALQIELQ